MDLNWMIVVAQIVNFVGLVWLLHRFLYEPILNAIEAREARLAERFDEAHRLTEKARGQIVEYEAKRIELERTREQYLQDARAEARRTLRELLAQAEAEAEGARRRLSEQLAQERRELEQRLQETIVRQASAASEHLLQTLAGRSAADGVIDVWAEQLRRAHLENAAPPMTVRVSFSPTQEQRRRMLAILSEAAGRTFRDEDVKFVHDSSLLLGVELHGNGAVWMWHARHALAAWQDEALQQMDALAAAAAPVAEDGGGGR